MQCHCSTTRGSWWWKFFLGFSLHRTHTHTNFPPYFVRWRGRAPRHMVLTGIHANTRHKWWNSAKMKGEHMMMEEFECLIFFSRRDAQRRLQQQYGRFSLAGLQFISRTISAKTSFTFILFLAEASMKGQFHAWAKARPSIVATSRWCSRSTLFPTSSKGTRSVPFTRVI